MVFTRPLKPRGKLMNLLKAEFAGTIVIALLLIAPLTAFAQAATFQPWWVQNFTVTHLWSGPDQSAVDYGTIPQWSYLQVVQPQSGSRLAVYVPWTQNYAYVNASDVGPSGPPPAGWSPFASPTPSPAPVTTPSPTPAVPATATPTSTTHPAESSAEFKPYWVLSNQATDLWSGPDQSAADYGPLPQGSYLQVVVPRHGPRLYVYVPGTKNYAYVDAKAVGQSDAPPPGWNPLLRGQWEGKVIDKNDLWERTAPNQSAPVVKKLPYGTIIYVTAWVNGQEIINGNWTWGKLADGNYFYSNSAQIVRPTTPPPPPADHPSGKWVDVNTLRQTAVAYENDTPVYMAIVSSGSPGWETPPGIHWIWRRVPDETMKSSTLTSLGLDALQLSQAHYDLKGVLYTQYFDGFGDALHDNYWTPSWQFGVPHSHGCVGMPEADAHWFWNWANIGTPVVVHG